MVESFYLSNVVPQNLENNAGFWNRFEMYCRDLTQRYASVYILSGPLVMPQINEGGKKFVTYEVGSTICILIDFSIHIDTISMGLHIVHFKGS